MRVVVMMTSTTQQEHPTASRTNLLVLVLLIITVVKKKVIEQTQGHLCNHIGTFFSFPSIFSTLNSVTPNTEGK